MPPRASDEQVGLALLALMRPWDAARRYAVESLMKPMDVEHRLGQHTFVRVR